MATAVVVEPFPSMSVAWTVSVYLGTLCGEKESGRPLRAQPWENSEGRGKFLPCTMFS